MRHARSLRPLIGLAAFGAAAALICGLEGAAAAVPGPPPPVSLCWGIEEFGLTITADTFEDADEVTPTRSIHPISARRPLRPLLLQRP